MIIILDFLSNIIQQVITILYNLTDTLGFPNYGIAIILMTVLVKIILYPVTAKQIKSTKAMMDIQPKMKAIQTKYKDDKMRMNQELAALYKREGVSPLAGCLPLLIQMPIMIGIFYGVRDYNYVGPASFLWMKTIAEPDPMYILPVVSAVATFFQSKLSTPAADENIPGGNTTKYMTYFMPLFVGYISLEFPAGLIIYWIVMSIMQIAQQLIMDANNSKAVPAKKK